MIRRYLLSACVASFVACAAHIAWAQAEQTSDPGFLDVFENWESDTERTSRADRSGQTVKGQSGAQPGNEADSGGHIVRQNATANEEAADQTAGAEGSGGESKPPESEEEKRKKLAKAVAKSHNVVFWNNNFEYLLDPDYDNHHLGEDLKRLDLGNCFVLDVGGAYRMRYHEERNMRGLGLTGRDDSFILHQTRLYGNLQFGDRVRAYAEMIDAVSELEDFAPRPIEEDRSDFLNLFIDVKLYENCCGGSLSARVGRQELIYGNQRLVSPLPWGNTRRTFEGYNFRWRSESWDIDGFWTRPVVKSTKHFNNPDQSREFMGVYSTFKDLENETLDLYFLRFLETDGAGFDFNTFGFRWQGSQDDWLWETEVAGQFGDVGAASQNGWTYTLGGGRNIKSMPWETTFWTYFDFASGDAGGNGFHHLFPLGHKYLGFMDLFGRRNIEDLNFLLTTKPCPKLKLLAWWHIFHLQDGADVPYNVNMTPFVGTPGGSSDLGQELDLLAGYNIGPTTDLLLGYSHFFAGDFYGTNPSPAPFDGDADFYYVQFTQNF